MAADEESIVFSAAPTHTKAETNKLYKPLLNHLSQSTGRKFILETAANVVEFSTRMRLGQYDLIFDDPHLTAWRIVNMQYTPVVRLDGAIKIVVVAKNDVSVNSLQELESGVIRVCSLASPNISTVAFLSHFTSPVQQPSLIRTQGEKELLQCIMKGQGDAAVMHESLWASLDEKRRENYRIVAELGREYPERTLSASTKIDETLRKQIAEAILSEEGQKATQALREALKRESFIPAGSEEYEGLQQLLRSVWGFHSG
ncbi:MAG: phosphate/phosphite/phosphonate ABC transporter substrate-binding protein [Chromatiales bacterium]|nr:phosphate/phosphite/phosphonate ABC transporter substrate-binding protein [Chromatiales bacterium]